MGILMMVKLKVLNCVNLYLDNNFCVIRLVEVFRMVNNLFRIVV